MLINSSLDQPNISLGDDSFSNGNGQHAHCISEKNPRRQQKMHGPQKQVVVGDFKRKLVWTFGLKWKKMG